MFGSAQAAEFDVRSRPARLPRFLRLPSQSKSFKVPNRDVPDHPAFRAFYSDAHSIVDGLVHSTNAGGRDPLNSSNFAAFTPPVPE